MLLDASESAVRALDLRRFDLIHFATHSVFNDQRPERSAIVLAPDAAEDGLLQARELYRPPLRARLVILSTCEGGLGTLVGLGRLRCLRRRRPAPPDCSAARLCAARRRGCPVGWLRPLAASRPPMTLSDDQLKTLRRRLLRALAVSSGNLRECDREDVAQAVLAKIAALAGAGEWNEARPASYLWTILPARQAAVVLALQGHTAAEVASLLGASVKNVQNLIFRGTADLRRCLEDKGFSA